MPRGKVIYRDAPKSRWIWLVVAGVAAACAIFWGWEWFAHPRAREVRLTDGTEVYFRRGTSLDPVAAYPNPREVRLDGEIFLRVSDQGGPLVVRSRLMVLAADGGSELRVTAFASQGGEEVEVLRGRVVASKAYESHFAEPETLGPGDMVMVNREIDLMEKETWAPEDVPGWRDKLLREAALRKGGAEIPR